MHSKRMNITEKLLSIMFYEVQLFSETQTFETNSFFIFGVLEFIISFTRHSTSQTLFNNFYTQFHDLFSVQ